jgi:hypothetical protein
MHIEDTQRLVTEIEMLKVVYYLVSRERRKEESSYNIYVTRSSITQCD